MTNAAIASRWEDLAHSARAQSDPIFLEILARHGFGNVQVPVPLKKRYTRGRAWTKAEFEACFEAWREGVSLTLIAASLNRNPQDMIYKLLDRCEAEGMPFTQSGRSEGSENWSLPVAACARDLFGAGLPAWKIAATFRVDFEHVEKALFQNRKDYGHNKRNPFSIHTDHKYVINRRVLNTTDVFVRRALEPFAGEGRTTRLILEAFPDSSVLAIEQERDTLERAMAADWGDRVHWVQGDNRAVLPKLPTTEPYQLIDLDPFVSCHEQVPLALDVLDDEALLFVTFGGEYRRSFIGSNRKAIAKRYGYWDPDEDNRAYLNVVPQFFLGWIAKQAADRRFRFQVIRAMRYANNCRFWLRVGREPARSSANNWLDAETVRARGGICWRTLKIPRFREMRHELDTEQQGSLAL